ncbi:DNA polymerase III, beta subunit [Frankia casuarinae]|jgi:DNA polymerase-3 subunit beta|uniref:Beta sliding clamp n=1 Tax=Frankia casuarinae (strain DSM 45818 / CECT 9043 / HFP020203 / CcI3) TaxID=106370 RepID=Q2JH45_FRACC|nr:DNA polymerase III subunit beta [Frankia casuarinae]ABD09397.1 DNA polymerase III, beta subunit [Frankia casuarinae]EYT94201.1 DNA polymerase III, beta subunit [Frankia casuarinae]
MKFRVERDEFTEAVAWTARTLPSRPTTQLQVLSGLLLDATGPILKIAAYDYEVAAQCTVHATVSEEGRGLVNGKLLAEITRALPAAPVDLGIDGTRLVITCGNARFALPMLPVDDYPALPAMPPITGHIEGSAFAAAVSQVAIAAGRDDTLPVLTGVRIEIEGDTLTLAATDRYRLAVRTLKWRPSETAAGPDEDGVTGVDGPPPTPVTVALVPARTLLDTAKSLSGSGVEVSIALGTGPSGETLAGFAGSTRQTTTRLLDGSFPPYRKLLPDSSPLIAQLEIAPLQEAVKRVALVAAKTAPVQLTFSPDHLVLEAGTGGEAQATETLPVTYDGPELSVAFNPSYLLDALGALESDVVRIGFASAEDPAVAANKPAILTGKADDDGEVPDYRYLLMPIRLHG